MEDKMRLVNIDYFEVLSFHGKSLEFINGVQWILEEIDKQTIEESQYVAFPHTIGNITFYNRKELEDWVIAKQSKY